MKIHRLVIQNFRSFRDSTELGKVNKVNTFVGANNAGKSNVIEILSFLRSLANNKLSRDYSEFTFDRNKKPINIEIEFELDEPERRNIIDSITTPNSIAGIDLTKEDIFKFLKYQANVGEQRCLDESLYAGYRDQYIHIVYYLWTGKNNNLVERRFANINGHFHNRGSMDGFLQLQPSTVMNTNSNVTGIFEPHGNDLLGLVEMTIIIMIKEFFKKIRIFGAHRKAEPKYEGGEKRRLLESGENLIEVMSTMLGDNRGVFDAVMKQYSEIIGHPLVVNVPLAESEQHHTVTIEEDGLMTQTDFRNMSTGLHESLILILAIYQARPFEVICIEEPEIHLHSSAQKRLFRFICTHALTNQFFITTHSSIFTGLDSWVSTYLVTRSEGNSQISLIEKESELKFIKQQLGIRNSDTFGSDYIIFVEGKSEEYAFPIVANALGLTDVGTDVAKKIRVMNLEGNGIIGKLEEFLEYLKDSDVGVFLIADGDKKVKNFVEDFVRRKILEKENYKIWDKEFEDTFESKRLVEAMKRLAMKNNFKFTMTEVELETARLSGKKVPEIFQKYLHDLQQPDLDKPALTIQLANDIAEEIRDKQTRTETKFEFEIKRIWKMIVSMSEP